VAFIPHSEFHIPHSPMKPWSFHSAGSLVFGRDAVKQLPAVLTRLRAKRVFVVTDKILEAAGTADRVRAELGPAVASFHVDKPEPAVETVRAAAAAAKAFGPDAVLGLGGGSNMDTAKLVALVLAHGGDPLDFVGDCRVPGPVWPLVCVPTTAGTGSEVSAAAVFTDTAKQIKVSCLSPYLRPAAAVVDPLLTVSCPPKVTADSGIDALTHAIEAFTAVDQDEFVDRPPGGESVYQGKNPMADHMASECIMLIGRFLRRAVKDGTDLEAREGMAMAATLGGLAFANSGVALVHAMEYPVGGAVHVSHGAGNGLLLPYVMRYNTAVRADAIATVGLWVAGPDGAKDVGKAGKFFGPGGAEHAIRQVEQLRKDICIPTRLRDLGVTEDMLPGFAAKAFSIKRLMRVNPRMPRSEAEILEIYRAAF
jgi:alcohol dehydrogenase class IV